MSGFPGGWEVNIRTELPDGTNLRERRKAPVGSKSGAKRWGEHRERELILEKQANAAEGPPESVMLKVAVEWDVIGFMPCTVKLLRVAPAEADFHDFDEYERLVESAKAVDTNAYLVVLLGGDAGFRCGEMRVHILRHSFCSHLAMRGAPAKAIQELAGHRDLATTQRYMHLSPAAVEGAIRLLQQPAPVSQFGDILETVTGVKVNAKD